MGALNDKQVGWLLAEMERSRDLLERLLAGQQRTYELLVKIKDRQR